MQCWFQEEEYQNPGDYENPPELQDEQPDVYQNPPDLQPPREGN